MQDLLANPAVQSALAPLLAAIVVALALKPLRLSGLAAVAGYAACIALAVGFAFSPLSAARKIVLLTLVGAGVGVIMDFVRLAAWRIVVAVAAAAAMAWVLIVALQQRETVAALAYGAGLAAYAAVVAFGFDRLAERPLRAGSAGVAMGIGAGLSALVGASALLGQMGLALGAASGGFLLVQMIANRPFPAGRAFTLPVALGTGLASGAAVILAKLPWYALPLLAAVPFAAALPFGERLRPWLQAILFTLVASVFAAGAVAVVRGVLGPMSL